MIKEQDRDIEYLRRILEHQKGIRQTLMCLWITNNFSGLEPIGAGYKIQ